MGFCSFFATLKRCEWGVLPSSWKTNGSNLNRQRQKKFKNIILIFNNSRMRQLSKRIVVAILLVTAILLRMLPKFFSLFQAPQKLVHPAKLHNLYWENGKLRGHYKNIPPPCPPPHLSITQNSSYMFVGDSITRYLYFGLLQEFCVRIRHGAIICPKVPWRMLGVAVIR